MKRIVLFLALFFVPFLYAAEYTPASVPNPKKQGQEFYVSNPDGILADSTVVWLNDCSVSLEERTGVEMCFVVLESIGDADAFDFAYELFQRWGIGKEGKNTGVLVLFALNSHDLRIMTGTGIEGVLTDAKCSQIMHDEMFPSFRSGDYDGGLCLGALAIYEECTDGDAPMELQNIRSVTNRGQYADEEDDGDEMDTEDIITLCSLIGFIVMLILVACFGSIKKCPQCHKRKAHATRRETLVHATYDHAGKEKVTYTCKNCGHVFVRDEILPKLIKSSGSSGRGGGYSSGRSGGSWGGGSTSGGGAGGKW